jgi:DNA-binding CsgD family transcriptional regulator/tetratricopeptide (TPR) repeat protein
VTGAGGSRGSGLLGRRSECAALDAMIAAARTGDSRVVVLSGEAGAGKTALLDYAAAAAGGFQVLRAVGVQSEMELPYAALHQLCGPVLDRADRLPGPQRGALATVFGLQAGAPPDRLLVGLAVLSLLALVSEDRPLLGVVDDVQWLDRASAQVLGFVGRRLMADPVMLAFGTRREARDLTGLPELGVPGLRDADARALLAPALRFVVDAQTRDRIVAEARGNPLALLELPRGLRLDQLAGGGGLLPDQPLTGRIEESFLTRIAALSDEARLVLLIAAAEPVGEADLLWRAAERLGVDAYAAADDDFETLLTIDDKVTFRHPLVRSAVYRGAAPDDRRAAHLALAEVTDATVDPDRRAWHLASAAVGPDDAVAAELERSAGRAQARGGLAAAAALLQRAVTLTGDTSLRGDRAVTAAQVSLHAGEFEVALRMVAVAEAGVLDEPQQARAALLRGQIAFASGHGGVAPPLLLAAADRFRRLDVDVARETYLEAWGAALFAGALTDAGGLLDAALAAGELPPAEPPRPSDLLLDGLAALTTAGPRAAAPLLRRATEAFASPEVSIEDNFRWGWLTTVPSNVLWDEQSWDTINTRQLDAARRAGALARLPLDLTATAVLVAWRGDFPAAEAAIAEADTVIDVTDTAIAPFGAMLLAALRGREDEATALIDSALADAVPAGQAIALQYARWISAILFNGLSRYEQAFDAAQQAVAEAPELFLSAWALPELVEAGVMTGNAEVATDALERLTEAAAAAGTDWALGVAARSRALLADAADADDLFGEAIDRLLRTRLRPELARTHLAYGEWLRRRGRRVDARAHLRAAHELFVSIGMEAFAERSRRELLATGETVRKRTVSSSASAELTPQERQIALLVRDGLSNPEVGARLFLSSRTVEWHLRKVFAKLSISSRRQLRDALPNG